MHKANYPQLAQEGVVSMVGQIIFGALGVFVGGVGLIAFVVSLAKSKPVSVDEVALRKREYERAKRRSDGCSLFIAFLLGITLLIMSILR